MSVFTDLRSRVTGLARTERYLWVATGLTAGFIYLPRATRLAVGTLAVLAGADLLQFGYSWLQERERSWQDEFTRNYPCSPG